MSTISVIIPTYNRAKYLPRALESVLTQTHKDLELIIVDDASSDSTTEYLKSITDPRFSVIKHNNNLGVSAARNTGIKAAKNKWIAFLDSDDEWLTYKLQKQIELINAHPHIKIIHSNEQWLFKGVKKNQPSKYKRYGGYVFEKCLPLCSIGPSTSLVHKEVFDTVGLFNEAFPVCEDYDFWLRATYKFKVGLVEDILVNKHGGHDDQLSVTHHELDYWRTQALVPFIFDKEAFSGLSKGIQKQLKTIMLRKCERLTKVYSQIENKDKSDQIQAYLKQLNI